MPHLTRRPLLAAICLAPIAFAASPAFAAEATATSSEVVVIAPSIEATLPEDLAKSGVRVDIIPDKEIRDGNYRDVAQALQQLAPGLFILPKNGPFDYVDISFQGSRTSDVLWMVDGVRINNRLYAGTTPLDTLPASMVDHVEMLEGGQSLFYGTSAIAGAVNVVTRGFSERPDGQATLGVDTNGGRHIDGYYRDSYGKSHVVLYGSADKSDGYKAFRDQDYQPSATDRHRSYDVYTLGAKYALDVTDQLRLSASYQHTDADLDFALPYRVARDVNSRKEDLATVKADYTPTDRLSFYLKAYYHRWHTHYDTDYNDLGQPGVVDVIYGDAFWGYDDRGVNALGKYEVAKGVEAYFGYDYQRYGGRDEVLVILPQKEQTHAVFGQLRLTPDLLPGASLAAGFRYNDPSKGKSATIWNVSGRYDYSSALFVRGEVGTNFRLPTAEELFADDPLDERGDPNLKPERSFSANLSVGGRASFLHWELIGFARNIKNLIDLDTFDDVTQQDVFGNLDGEVHVRGAELVVGADFTPDWSLNANYTHSRSRQEGGQQLAKIPKDLVKASLDYHPADLPIGATLTATYTGDTYVSIAGASYPYGDYAVVDLSGRYYLDVDHRKVLTLSIQNLFDAGYGLPGRGCIDNPADGPFDCTGGRYIYVNRGLPRTLSASFTYGF